MMVRSYKGYEGVVTFVDTDANLITGEIVNIQDGVNFQARTPAELQRAFEESVDEYLADCARRGTDPDRPFSGQLNVRLGADLHRAAHIAARLTGQSLNAWIKDVVAREASTLPSIAREAGAFASSGARAPGRVEKAAPAAVAERGAGRSASVAMPARKRRGASQGQPV